MTPTHCPGTAILPSQELREAQEACVHGAPPLVCSTRRVSSQAHWAPFGALADRWKVGTLASIGTAASASVGCVATLDFLLDPLLCVYCFEWRHLAPCVALNYFSPPLFLLPLWYDPVF